MNYRDLSIPLPTSVICQLSELRGYDFYYSLPYKIEVFIERANQELPGGYYVVPQTLFRNVTVKWRHVIVAHISYDAIEIGLVRRLDELKHMIREYEVNKVT